MKSDSAEAQVATAATPKAEDKRPLVACLNCGALFRQARPWQKFDTAKCRTMHYFDTHVLVTKGEYKRLTTKVKGGKK